MAVDIITKHRTASATAPTGLAEGELAVNLFDDKLYVGPTGGGNGTLIASGTAQWDDVTGGINYSGGDVGIGQSTPLEKLHILDGNIRLTQGQYMVWLSNGGSERARVIGDSSNSFIVATGGSALEKMRINTSGNMGLGTDAPLVMLEIARSSSSQTVANIPTVRLTSLDTVVQPNDITGSFEFFSKDAGSLDQITGFVRSFSEDSGASFALIFGTKAPGLQDAVEGFRISAAGNVNIGPSGTTPTVQLQVEAFESNALAFDCIGRSSDDASVARWLNNARNLSLAQITVGNANMTIATQGKNAIVITAASGNVQMGFNATVLGSMGFGGITTPGRPIDVLSGTAAIAIRIRGRLTDDIAVLEFTDQGGTPTGTVRVDSTSGGLMRLFVAGTEKVTIRTTSCTFVDDVVVDGTLSVGGSAGSSQLSVLGGSNVAVLESTTTASRLSFLNSVVTSVGVCRIALDSNDMNITVGSAVRLKLAGISGVVSGLWNEFGAGNGDATFQKLTQAQYDGITPDADTIYFIVG